MSNGLHWNPNLVQEPLPSCALPLPRPHPRHHQPVLGARHADIEKTAGLLQLEFVEHAVTWDRDQLLVLDTDDVHARKLETLGRMHREKIHAIWSGVDAVVLRQHRSLQKSTDARRQLAALAGLDQS